MRGIRGKEEKSGRKGKKWKEGRGGEECTGRNDREGRGGEGRSVIGNMLPLWVTALGSFYWAVGL